MYLVLANLLLVTAPLLVSIDRWHSLISLPFLPSKKGIVQQFYQILLVSKVCLRYTQHFHFGYVPLYFIFDVFSILILPILVISPKVTLHLKIKLVSGCSNEFCKCIYTIQIVFQFILFIYTEVQHFNSYQFLINQGLFISKMLSETVLS